MKLSRSLIIFLTLLVIWQALVGLFRFPAFIVPGPGLVLKSLIQNGRLIAENAWPTFIESLAGFFLGSLVGAFAALMVVYFQWARFWFLPLMITSQALPVFAIAPLVVLWFGYGMASKILVAMIMIFFPVASAFYDGLTKTPSEWLYLGQIMGGKRWELLWRIRVPAALPSLASGLRLAAVFAPMGAIIGEWVGSGRGLGFLMLNANARMQVDLMFASLFILIFFTLFLYFAVNQLLKKWITFEVS